MAETPPGAPPLTLTARPAPLVGTGTVLAVPVHPGDGGPTAGRGADVLASLGVDATAVLAADRAKGDAGEVTAVPVGTDAATLVLLVGVGDGSPAALRKAGAAVVRRARRHPSLATTVVDGTDADVVRAFAEGVGLASYTFRRRQDPKPDPLTDVAVVVDDPRRVQPVLDRTAVVVAAVRLARDLGNEPSLVKTPAWFAEHCAELAREVGVDARIRDARELASEGFGGVVGVGQGSARPPALLELTWQPRGAKRHVVLVGKGITFDSGGLSIKPADSMTTMKTDMCGGAAVVGAMTALARLGAKVRVTALVPLAENMPGGGAIRPSDVLRHYGGRTTEVINTDAEGRLVLADALAYAAARLAPDVVVDLATLTGAATLGLGKRHAALYATDDTVRDQLVAAAATAGERVWPMPIVEEYAGALESPVADQRNVADAAKGFSGGSIVAALFLREFTGGVPWAHLDIAGPARADGDEDEVTKGATGWGVRTLVEWLAPR